MPRTTSRILLALALGVLLLVVFGLVRAVGPAYGENTDPEWSVTISPENPQVGDLIEVTFSPHAESPLSVTSVYLEDDGPTPVLALEETTGVYDARLTLRALRPGTATLSIYGFLEKTVCPGEPTPCFPYGFYASSPTVTIHVSGELKLCADANNDGATNSLDSLLVLQYSAGFFGSLWITPVYPDTDGNGDIDSRDAALILQVEAGLLEAGELHCT